MEVKDKKGFCYYLYIFFSISIFAWILEILYSLIFRSKLVSPGVLIGPWCPIYGTCGLLFFIFTKKEDMLMLNFTKIFLAAAFIEYLFSYISEKLYNHIIWNYSKYMFNINGRICLHMTLLFTVMGLIFMYVIEPFLRKKYKSMEKVLNIVSVILLVLFILDWGVNIFYKW